MRVAFGAEAQGSEVADARRLRKLFDDHFNFVWRTLRRLGVSPEAADDGAQEVFLVASRKLSAIEPGSERAFLFGTATRVAANARRARRAAEGDDALERREDPAPRADELLDRKRAADLLDSVLDAMPDDLRAVFVLAEFEQMTMADIAALLEVPAGTVASRLRRAREEFQRRVQRLKPRTGGGGT